MADKYLTVQDVQNILSLSRTQSYALVNQNGFPKIKIGNSIRIPQLEFEKYLKHNLYKTINIK